MGYERNNAIIVSARYSDGYGDRAIHWAEKAHAEAVRIFNQEEEPLGDGWDIVSPIVRSPVNDVRSFFIAPDGSKEGWGTSDLGDTRRAEFVAWLEALHFEDLSSPLQWVEVQYGDDDDETIVVNDSEAAVRAPCPKGCGHPFSHHGSDGCGDCTCELIR